MNEVFENLLNELLLKNGQVSVSLGVAIEQGLVKRIVSTSLTDILMELYEDSCTYELIREGKVEDWGVIIYGPS